MESVIHMFFKECRMDHENSGLTEHSTPLSAIKEALPYYTENTTYTEEELDKIASLLVYMVDNGGLILSAFDDNHPNDGTYSAIGIASVGRFHYHINMLYPNLITILEDYINELNH